MAAREHVQLANFSRLHKKARSCCEPKTKKKRQITKIGSFSKTSEGQFQGALQTLTLNRTITFEPNNAAESEKAPDYKIVLAGSDTEIGAGWNAMSKKDKPYIKAKIDDPFLPHTIWAALTADDDGQFNLFWSRSNGQPSERNAEQDKL